MKKNSTRNWMLWVAIASLLAAIIFAFSDNLSELAPVFLGVSILSVIVMVFRKSRQTQAVDLDTRPLLNQRVSYFITGFVILGVLTIGFALLSLFSPNLSEFAPVAIVGGLFLIVALLLRIFNGVIAKRIDTTSGILSMATILLLVGIILLMGAAAYVIYSILTGLSLL